MNTSIQAKKIYQKYLDGDNLTNAEIDYGLSSSRIWLISSFSAVSASLSHSTKPAGCKPISKAFSKPANGTPDLLSDVATW